MCGQEPENRTAEIVKPGIGRRGLLEAATGLALAGALGVPAAPIEAARKRRASSETGLQPWWRYCKKCRALHSVWDGNRGVCPAGGVHSTETSYNYEVWYGDVPARQGDWFYCKKCRALHSVWDGNRGVCAAGGVHSIETSVEYRLYTGGATNPDLGNGYGIQGDWFYCKKCRVLHSLWDGNRGRCAAGGVHSIETSLVYSVLYRK